MEFNDLGKHCSAENCGQQDFLPFKCNACGGVFCLEHRTHAGHSCNNATFNDKRVLECSMCNKVLKRSPGAAHDVLLQRHLASGCTEGVRKARPNKLGCSAEGCRGSEFVKVSCKSCRKNFCFRHRHEDDHKCQVTTAKASRQQRGSGGSGGSTSNPSRVQAARAASGDSARGGGCGTEAGEAAARRQREAQGRRAGTEIAAR